MHIGRSEDVLDVLCTFNLRPVSKGFIRSPLIHLSLIFQQPGPQRVEKEALETRLMFQVYRNQSTDLHLNDLVTQFTRLVQFSKAVH